MNLGKRHEKRKVILEPFYFFESIILVNLAVLFHAFNILAALSFVHSLFILQYDQLMQNNKRLLFNLIGFIRQQLLFQVDVELFWMWMEICGSFGQLFELASQDERTNRSSTFSIKILSSQHTIIMVAESVEGSIRGGLLVSNGY